MSAKRRSSRQRQPGASPTPEQAPAAAEDATVRVRRTSAGDGDVWELVHPRCARDRREDLQEVRAMLDAGEIDVARDECRWLLSGCSDCIEAHRVLGEIALAENDLALARGHFGYAYRLGAQALERAGNPTPMPYRLAANQAFFESGKALAFCLVQLGKRDMAAEVVEQLLRCDAGDPLGVKGLLADADCGDAPGE